jgi:tape measure domain-containing protein
MAKSNAILNIIFGADTKQLDRALGGVAKRMRETAGNLDSLGKNLSVGLTTPLVGLAGVAVKAAADLETMRTQFVSLTGGAEQAGRTVNQLNEFAAQTPFEIEGIASAAKQLLASGTDVGQLNDQLKFLGDIAAVSGSSIDEIAAIFSKVQAKGKVELESLNQLAERGVPVFRALSEATGLLPSELGAGAVSVEQFTQVLAGMSEEGGFAFNAMQNLSQTAAGKFSTAMDALKMAAASLGEVLLPIATAIIERVTEWAEEFAELDRGTKVVIAVMGALAAALGPLLIAAGAMINGYTTLRGALKLLTIEQLKLNAAALANPYVLAAAAIAGLGIAIFEMSKRSTDAESKVGALRDRVNELTDAEAKLEAQKAISDQAEKVRKLASEYEVLSKQRAQGDQFEQRIFNQRKQQVKDELANAEKTLAGFKAVAEQRELDAYISRVRQKELDKERKAAVDSLNGNLNATSQTEAAAKTYTETLEEKLAAIDAEYKITGDLNDRVTAQAAAFREAAIAAQLLGNETEALALKQEMLNRSIAPEPLAVAPLANAAVTPEIVVSGSTTGAINQLIEATTGAGTAFDNARQKGLNFANDVAGAIESAVEGMVVDFAMMAGAALSSGQGMKGMGRMILTTLADLAIQVGQIAIGVGISIEGIKKALATLNPAVAIIAGIALVAIGSFAKSELAKAAQRRSSGGAAGASLGVPAFAQGGLVTGPMLAMVGDNPSGKEAIIPFERMGEFMKMMGGGQSAQQVVVTGRISGRDLILSNERTRYDRTRTKG